MKNNRTFLEKLLEGSEVEWKPLDEVANIVNNARKPVKSSLRVSGNIPYYGANNIQDYVEGYTHEGEFVLIAEDGSASLENYSIQWAVGKFWANNHVHVVNGKEKLNNRFLYHYLTNMNFIPFLAGKERAKLTKAKLQQIPIPIPPLSVQTEIVKILDALTALTSELILRQKQYEYYREKLLSHNDSENSSQQKVDKDKLFSTSNIQWLHLNEIYKFQYGIGNKIPTIGGEYPVYGSNGIVGSHNEYNSEDAPVIGHIGAYAGIVNWAEGKHFVTYNGIICNKINDNVNSRYAYYLLLSQNFIDKANKASQPFISYDILNKCIVPVPPIEEQQRIVSILDKFETLTNSITEGLPLAIEQSQKRYEYYRELLLNFS